ncbi:glycosyltransferase family 1 protein [Pseudoalteromonas sp. SWXJ133]|jgi:spore coat polysaccharide biosynthesis predicted glycosyltransferase SpsG|uniref:glycosyltransferase n=1 Tax=unclassified Pseudoalteromonas TaxID=194690 RepID=UPI001409DE02|nr:MULTISPECIES: glycosyltransferase family 1 protein [unclassified Pseudoalteromonas]MBH0022204.1 glycosyltransferase family 1 protein [Pseudoalteromonas sp. SWXJ133]
MSNKRLLFIPVSSPQGIGEYMRSLLLAQSLQSELADSLDIHFILNKHTSYAKDCPFETTLLEHSATKELDSVCDFIETFKPDIVVFDCAGRAGHMKAAKKVGAKVIFISQHAKKRAKGLKLNRINLIDTHWVVQPDYCIEPLTWAESTKLDMFPLAHPRNVGPFVAFASSVQKRDVLNRYNLVPNDYFIVNAGSGGHSVNNLNCADVYFEAALKITKLTGLKAIIVFGPNYNKSIPKSDELICLASLQNTDFLALMSQAKIALLSGGDTLLQAIAVQTPVVACAISKDQNTRLEHCANRGVVIKANLDVDEITTKIAQVIAEPFYNEFIDKYNQSDNSNSYDVIINGIKSMLAGESQ